MSFHERLTALDASFLGIESDAAPMHVGALLIFEGGPLAREGGGIDYDRLCRYTEAVLEQMPRYRQRLSWVPGLRHPVWVDDEHFTLQYHLRHTALPQPGDERTLKRLAARIFSQRLDRTRPLWEFWLVEGLEGGRFALIPKIHHCMIDGVAGVESMGALLRGTPDETLPSSASWAPRPSPSRSELLASELEHRARGSRMVLDTARKALSDLRGWWDGARDTAEGLMSTLGQGLSPASPTPLNPKDVGPYRRFDVCRMDLGEIKAIKQQLGGKVNDVVLTVASGALARYLARREVDLSDLADFRALVPVNVRKDSETGAGGNRVALMITPLPITEHDPVRRYERVRQITGYMKNESRQVESSALIEELSDMTASSIIREVFRFAGRQRAFNVVITNVPGPPFPLYLLGARLLEISPFVPLFRNQAVGLALFSYAGSLHWGLSADWAEVPDLHELVDDLDASFQELRAAAAAVCGPDSARS